MDPVKVQIFRFLTACIKINQISFAFFKSQVSFPLIFATLFSVMTHNPSEIF